MGGSPQHEAFEQASQALSTSGDFATLLRLLSGYVGPLALFVRTPHTQSVRHYYLDRDRLVISQDNLVLRQGPGFSALNQGCLQRMTGDRFRQAFPELATQPPYIDLSYYTFFPLQSGGPPIGGLELLSRKEASLPEDKQAFLERLLPALTRGLQAFVQKETLSTQASELLREREELQILVDVTNMVLSTLDIDPLLKGVSELIQHFFGTDYVELDILEPHQALYRSSLIIFRPTGKTFHSELNIPASSALAERAVQTQSVWLGPVADIQELSRQNAHAAQLIQEGFQSICMLPLMSGARAFGALVLAHREGQAPFDRHVSLLKHIAARIAMALDNALAYQEISHLKDLLTHENLALTEEIRSYKNFDEIIAQSPVMMNVLEQIEMVAASDCTVLILGETGTGKELVARAIHNMSLRQSQRMVTLNMAAIPSGLLESDLFGHEKGAFTGANAQRLGRFEMAHQSTLFLDEVGDLPLELQPKLLRVLQEREVERLGGRKPISVDVRLIAATSCNLRQMVADHKYRSDLYYRLNVFPIVVPPLRDRPEDIPLLTKHFVQKLSRRMNRNIESIPTEVLERLQRHPWPGNVRELENITERAVILTKGSVLNLPAHALTYEDAAPPLDRNYGVSNPVHALPSSVASPQDLSTETEKDRIIRVLRETNGIVAGPKGAAARLGVKRTTLLSRMQRYGISARGICETDPT